PLADGTFAKTIRYGELLADVADRALTAARPAALIPLEVRTRTLFLPMDNPRYRLVGQLGVLDREMFLWSGDPAKAEPARDPEAEQRVAIRTEVGYLRFGDLQIAAIPGEVYPELVLGKVQDPPDPGADFPNA